MTTEVLTGYTEQDTPNRLSETASAVTITGLANNENVFLYKDFGAGYFTTSFSVFGNFTVTSSSGVNSAFACGVNDQPVAWVTASGTDNGLIFNTVEPGGGVIQVTLRQKNAGVQTYSTLPVFSGAFNTTYYYDFRRIPSLGQYGSIWIGIYSDAARTSLIDSLAFSLTGSHTYQYFCPVQSLNNGLTVTHSGTNANITLATPVEGVNLTAFTKVDPNTRFVSYVDSIVATTLNTNETAYDYKDYGVDYFSASYIVSGAVNVTAFGGGTGQMFNVLSMVNTLGHANLTNNLQGIAVNWISATTYSLKAREVSGATEYLSAASNTLTVGVPYWVQISRDVTVGTYGTLYVKIFRDPSYSMQAGSTISVTLHASVSFQYLNAAQSYNTGTSRNSSFTIGGLNETRKGALVFTTDDSLISVSAGMKFISSIAFTSEDAVVAITATKNSPLISVNFTTDPADVAISGAYKFVGTTGFTAADANVYVSAHVPTSAALSLTLEAAAVSVFAAVSATVEPFGVKIRHRTTGVAITGLTTVYLTVNQPSTGLKFDFNSNTFASSPVTPALVLNEVSASNMPGLYRSDVTTTLWSGWVEFEATYNDGTYTYSYSGEAYYTSGTRANGSWSVVENLAISAIKADTALLVTTVPTAAENAAAVWTRALEGSLTAEQMQRLLLSVLAGKVSGAGTGTEVFRDIGDTKARVTVTTDPSGNRTAVVRDGA